MKDIDYSIDRARAYCSQIGLEVVFTKEIPDQVLQCISKRTESLPKMYFASREMLKERLLNGCYLLKKGDTVQGHIFAHRHMVHQHPVFERSSLWIHPDHRGNDLGLLLMFHLTQRYQKDFLISIAQESKVHLNNELLGMKHITLSQISPVLIETLEEIGKLRDEYRYKYYVNPYFEDKIKQFNKVLGMHQRPQ
ncbi:MAG: hypothetical protein AAGA86_13830 [Bacteroidota bacterium]